MKNKNNICSIYHKRFKELINLLGNHRKAQLMDYILLGWHSSLYKLRGSNQKWFMKHYKEISEDTSIPESTLQKYIKELADDGFIVRRQALYSRKTEEGLFEVKKGNYIHPTDKLLKLINSSPESKTQTDDEAPKPKEINPNNSSGSDLNEGIDPLDSRGSYISDLHCRFNNIINQNQKGFIVNDVDKARRQAQFDLIKNFFTQEIKEEIPDSIKSLLIATFCTLIFKHKKEFSNPKQIAAEYLWAFVNVEYHMPWAKELKFRNNLFAKMIRNNTWRTPKGFFKHSWLASQFKKPSEMEQDWNERKGLEIKGAPGSSLIIKGAVGHKDHVLFEIEQQIVEKGELLMHLQEHILQQDSEEMILKIRAEILETRKVLEKLWDQQKLAEQEIGLCA